MNTAESENLSIRGNAKRAYITNTRREPPETSQRSFFELWERLENVSAGTADMYASQFDGSFVKDPAMRFP